MTRLCWTFYHPHYYLYFSSSAIEMCVVVFFYLIFRILSWFPRNAELSWFFLTFLDYKCIQDILILKIHSIFISSSNLPSNLLIWPPYLRLVTLPPRCVWQPGRSGQGGRLDGREQSFSVQPSSWLLVLAQPHRRPSHHPGALTLLCCLPRPRAERGCDRCDQAERLQDETEGICGLLL